MADTDATPASASALASNMRRLRGILAERQIAHSDFAAICSLNRAYVSRILTGNQQPGELASIKIARGIAALGLDREVQYAN